MGHRKDCQNPDSHIACGKGMSGKEFIEKIKRETKGKPVKVYFNYGRSNK